MVTSNRLAVLKKAQARRRVWLRRLNGTPVIKAKYDYWNIHCLRLCMA